MATYKTGWMKKLINGVSTKIFAISHVKAIYYDYANSKTLKSKLDEMDKSITQKATKASPVFTGYLNHGTNNSVNTNRGVALAGNNLTVYKNQIAGGHYNNYTTALACPDEGVNNSGSLLVLGNGKSGGMDNISNAFRVGIQGDVNGRKAYSSSGADYAEFFEWADGNGESEDRRGYFVTFDEEKPHMIRKATESDYILGIVSANPCIIGNSDEDWRGRFILDDFGDFILETTEVEKKCIDKETGEEKTETVPVTFFKQNQEYDPTEEYIHRKDRKEWDYVGMMGVLNTLDDGTCVAGGYCKCNNDGIATNAQERGIDTYRVLERVTENIVKVCIK